MSIEAPVHATMLDRSTAPKSGKLAPVAFPPFKSTRLSNGLPVFIVENHEQPIVSMSLMIRAGSALDPKDKAGLAAIVSDMLTKGTTTRSANQIAEEIEFVGGSLSSNASWDSLSISVGVLTKYLPIALELLADTLLNSTFPMDELERVRLQRIAGLRQAKADAGFLADMVFSQLVFGEHPYGAQSNGTEETIGRISCDDLANFHNAVSGPNNAFLIASGDVDVVQFLAELERLLGNWKPVELPKPIEVVPYSPKPYVAVVEKEGAVQSALRVGHVGVSRDDPDYASLSVLNMLLGGYFNSRINLNLREKHGFTYGARSYFDARIQSGPFAVSTEVRTDVTVRAIEEIINELTRITSEPISEEEVTMVKNYMIGSFPLQIETPQQVASRVAMIVLYGLPQNYYDTYRTVLSAITSEELSRVARKYLNPTALTVVASGDREALKQAMTVFGDTHVYDSDGKLVETVHAVTAEA